MSRATDAEGISRGLDQLLWTILVFLCPRRMHFCMFRPKHQDICGGHLLRNQAVCPEALTSELRPTKVPHHQVHITSKAATMISLAFFTWFLRVRAPASSHLFLCRDTFSTLQLSRNLLRCFIRKHCSLGSSAAASHDF